MRVAWVIFALGGGVGFAQAVGEVESIGFQGHYRPGDWTPMVVRLKATGGESGFHQIQVVQEDLDKDRVVFTRTVSLTGNAEGRPAREQRFWMYFISQPTGGGLPDPGEGLAALQSRLRVFLADADGKQIAALPITTTIDSLAPNQSNYAPRRDRKLVLAVVDPSTGSAPAWMQYASAFGLSEDVLFVPIRVEEIPDDVRGLGAVDAIVWFDADPSPATMGDEKIPVVREYVRGGGRLVICQSPRWRQTLAFGDLLPVTFPIFGDTTPPTQGVIERPGEPSAGGQPTGPLRVAAAEAKSGAIVDAWIAWNRPALPGHTPYVVRMGYGAGDVTWVAQDLGDAALTAAPGTQWPTVWDGVLGWNNRTALAAGEADRIQLRRQWGMREIREIGGAAMGGMEFSRKTAMYVLIALGFFAVYWAAAAPGAHFWLASRGRAGWGWVAFAGVALVATGLTAGVVRLVLRGPPQARMQSLIVTESQGRATVDSRIGLYIPRDGRQSVSLPDAAGGSWLTALAIHPQQLGGENEYPAYQQYAVTINEARSPRVDFPYRSTLKKLQVHWLGASPGAVQGAPAAVDAADGYLSGTITNGAGVELRDVYLAFRESGGGGAGEQVWIVYLPILAKGQTLDLGAMLRGKLPFVGDDAGPDRSTAAWGRANVEWASYWMTRARRGADDRTARAMLTFFGLIPPIPNSAVGMASDDRFDLTRTGARFWDRSGAVLAGRMVVLATADGGAPYAMTVDGAALEGAGERVYQCVLAMDRPTPAPPKTPATMPATTQPTTREPTKQTTAIPPTTVPPSPVAGAPRPRFSNQSRRCRRSTGVFTPTKPVFLRWSPPDDVEAAPRRGDCLR